MKETKAAAESKRIAGTKVQQAMGSCPGSQMTSPTPMITGIFPRNYAPILLVRNGEKVLVPARYLLRQAGQASVHGRQTLRELQRPARQSHQILASRNLCHTCRPGNQSFYENVSGKDGQNQVLHFIPRPPGVMLIACLYAEWSDPKTGEKLNSFAAVTDDPPAEVAAAGHDRMVIRLTRDNVDRWLMPQGRSDDELQAILSERQPSVLRARVAA